MPFLSMKLLASGYPGYANVLLNFTTEYNPEANATVVVFGDCYVSAGSLGGNLKSVSVLIKTSATDKPENVEISHMSALNVGSTSISRPPNPHKIYVKHGYEETKKTISVFVSASVTVARGGEHITATGSNTVVIKTGVASIVRVGDKVGSLYVAKDGKWHIGLPYAGGGGVWRIGIGHILPAGTGGGGEEPPSAVVATHDGAGNVYLENVTVLYDGNGGVTMNGVNAVIDSDGNVTIT